MILFGSWAVDNFISSRVTRAENRVAVVNNSREVFDWQNEVDLKLNNLEKTILRNRDIGPPVDASKLDSSQARMYQWSKELDSVAPVYSDWQDLLRHAISVEHLALATAPPSRVQSEINAAVPRIHQLHNKVDSEKKRFEAVAQKAAGPIRSVPDKIADEYADAAKTYRDAVMQGEIIDDYKKLKNALLQAEGDLRQWADGSVTWWRALAAMSRFLSLILYVVGTALVIGSKWSEAKTKDVKQNASL